MKTFFVVALLPLVLVACMSPRFEGRLQIAGRDLEALAKSSDVVVIGTIVAEGAVANIARDPNDVSREHPTLRVLAQEYRVAVENSLKGTLGGTILVTVARWDQRVGSDPVPNEAFIPLDMKARYLLFLRRHPYDPSLYAVAFEPSRFKLGTEAVVQSPWAEATTAFPARATAEFLGDVQRAIKAANGIPPR